MMHKKKILLSLLLTLALVLSACSGGGTAPAAAPGGESDPEQTFHWRFAHEEFVGSIQDVYVHELAELITEMSGGRITFDIFPVGQIGDATQQAELLQVGGIEFAMVSPGNTGTIVPENQLFSLHFLFDEDLERTTQLMWESYALNTMLSDLYLERNIKVLSYWTYGPMNWTANIPLRTPDDFTGLRFRTMPSPMIVAAYAAYGANPTPLPFLEVYSALQLGMVDAQENPFGGIYEAKFHEVQNYLIESHSNMYFTTTATNPDFFNGLPADIQQIILDAIEIMHWRSLEIAMEDDLANRRRIEDSGLITFIQLTPEERAAFVPFAETAWDVYRDMVGQTGSDILDRLKEEIAAMR
ncbi:MAG: TRAP transporter substrate-binding protein DctP [Oscillospiraceae bacterium]|nr:TRAP transporter substrate-binding protein DctP [Oscillospiraceae bacterium]